MEAVDVHWVCMGGHVLGVMGEEAVHNLVVVVLLCVHNMSKAWWVYF